MREKSRCNLYTFIEENSGNQKIKFDLLYYLNEKFNSKHQCDIIDFYSYFNNRERLIEWMDSRPKGNTTLVEYGSEDDIIVVIPTADYDGMLAKECRDVIFKGLKIIFVESGFPNDPYFNYAHSCNVGIKRALELGPTWIILSNDDMIKIDNIEVLRRELRNIKNLNHSILFTNPPGIYHSEPGFVAKANLLFKMWVTVRRGFDSQRYRIMEKLMGSRFFFKVTRNRFESKRLSLSAYFRLLGNIFSRKLIDLTYMTDFAIVKSEYVKQLGGMLFDERFINGYEDIDLALKIRLSSEKVGKVNFCIGEQIGSTIGNGKDRMLRNIASQSLFYEKYNKLLD